MDPWDRENTKDIQLPDDDAEWSRNNASRWPRLAYEDLIDYLINKKAYDGKKMKAFRSLYTKNYIESKWLGDVHDCKIGERHFFKAVVSPSEPGVGCIDYQTWVAVSDSSIETGYCTCPAGTDRTCSHIAAVAYAVIMAWEYGVQGETCTDKLRLWGHGASKVLKQHSVFSDIVYESSTKKLKMDDVSQPKQFLDHSDLLTYVNNSDMKPLWSCKGTILNKIMTAPAPETIINGTEALEPGCHAVD